MWQVLCTNLPLSAISGGGADEGELPDHPLALLIINVTAVSYMPEAEVFPSVHAELIEEGNGVGRIDGGEKRTVSGIELLIAAAARSGVMDNVACIAVEIRIAGIDPAEIGKQRDKPAIFLIDAVPRAMDEGNERPREYSTHFNQI